MTSAGLIIIGDEILGGKVRDENSLVFADVMFNRGVALERIITIPDDIEVIAKTVREYMQNFDYVATSGGIGPTHDDVTLLAISKSLQRPLEKNPLAYAYYRAAKGPYISDAQAKMLSYPKSSLVYFVEPLWLPLIRVENLFILPGIPKLFSQLIRAHGHLFLGSKFYREIIYTNQSESSFAYDLGEIQKEFPSCKIGSYPQEASFNYKVIVSVEGREENMVKKAASLIQKRLVS